MYINCLKEDRIPWRKQRTSPNNINGITKNEKEIQFEILSKIY
jgi:hypothetical protein